MLFRRADYSLEEVQAELVENGPSFFLNMMWLEEDISPKEPHRRRSSAWPNGCGVSLRPPT